MKVLFVCLGNICRSPLADGLLRKKLAESGLDVAVDSAGTAAYHLGEAPDSRMIATAKKRGTDLSFLRARQFVVSDFKDFDLIYAMDQSNYKNIAKLARTESDLNKLSLVLEELHPGKALEVPDPYYGGQAGFDEVYDLLDRCTDQIMIKLKQQHDD